jgi:hypothetical protein
VLLEDAREVALVGEARPRGDHGERSVAPRYLGRCPFQPQTASVLADGDAIASTKGAGKVDRMHADEVGQLAETDTVAESGAKQLLGGVQPSRRSQRRVLCARFPPCPGQQLERKPFCGQRGSRV